MNSITIHSPVDMHAHLRQDDMMRQVVSLTHPTWAGVLAMPNTDPPITDLRLAFDYFSCIGSAIKIETPFHPYIALYFQTSYTKEFLNYIRKYILSIKFYPKNLTTNSQYGCDPKDPKILGVLGFMEELNIPLNVHAEAEGYYHDRERLFGKYIYKWACRFPNLKIIIEHVSDKDSLELLDNDNVYATITPQHLLTTGNDWFGPPFNPHLYCMPCVKRESDRRELVLAATDRFPDRIMAGTDSAPHTENRKTQCGCAGVFSAPIAIQLYAQVFDRMNKLDRLQGFLSDNAKRIYGIEPPKKDVRLVRKPFVIPDRYLGDLVPMWAGKTIDWSVE